MRFLSLLLVALLGAFVGVRASNDVVISPTVPCAASGENCYALIYLQGASIPADRYAPIATQIQAQLNVSLWVGIPSFFIDAPNPLQLDSAINGILSNMTASGMPAVAAQRIFVAAHSLGGAMGQNWVKSNAARVRGQILTGSYLLRTNRDKFPVSTLSVGGELDGLARITRFAEAYETQNQAAFLAPAPAEPFFPVVYVPGMNHMQFATGDAPALVRARDLKSEITEQEAHARYTALAAAFINTLASKDAAALGQLQGAVAAAGAFFAPLIESFKLEGFYAFKAPCYDNAPSDACQTGSRWSERAQVWMAGTPYAGAAFAATDAFHPVSQINPIHLPAAQTNCTTGSSGCTVQITTVTENVYESLDSIDTGFEPISAKEMRVKLISRQAAWVAAGVANADFNVTDDHEDLCAEINSKTYEWALGRAAPTTAARHQAGGIPFTFGPDTPEGGGPLWIWTPLKFETVTDATGKKSSRVSSFVVKTPLDYWIKLSAGFHYCKLLSPARALEWIYVDSLRP